MGYYVKSQRVIARVLDYLETMRKSETSLEWDVPPGEDAAKLAYNIRAGIKASEYQGLRQYAGLSGKYIIRLKGGKIVAELRSALPFTMFKEAVSRLNLPEPTNLGELVGATVNNMGCHEIRFPNVNLSDGDVLMLFNWLTQVKSNFYIIRTAEGITLSKDDNSRELGWKPA